jgi:hypothetical protein
MRLSGFSLTLPSGLAMKIPPDEIRLPHQSKGTGQPVSVDQVSNNFFSTFGIPVLRDAYFSPPM